MSDSNDENSVAYYKALLKEQEGGDWTDWLADKLNGAPELPTDAQQIQQRMDVQNSLTSTKSAIADSVAEGTVSLTWDQEWKWAQDPAFSEWLKRHPRINAMANRVGDPYQYLLYGPTPRVYLMNQTKMHLYYIWWAELRLRQLESAGNPQYIHLSTAAEIEDLKRRRARLLSNLALAALKTKHGKNEQSSLGARDMALLDYNSTFSSGGGLIKVKTQAGSLGSHRGGTRGGGRRIRSTVTKGPASTRAIALAWARFHGDLIPPPAGIGSTVYHGSGYTGGTTTTNKRSNSTNKKTVTKKSTNAAAGQTHAHNLDPN